MKVRQNNFYYMMKDRTYNYEETEYKKTYSKNILIPKKLSVN